MRIAVRQRKEAGRGHDHFLAPGSGKNWRKYAITNLHIFHSTANGKDPSIPLVADNGGQRWTTSQRIANEQEIVFVERDYLNAQKSFIGAGQVRFRNICYFKNFEWITIGFDLDRFHNFLCFSTPDLRYSSETDIVVQFDRFKPCFDVLAGLAEFSDIFGKKLERFGVAVRT